jgi:hypothetical protein
MRLLSARQRAIYARAGVYKYARKRIKTRERRVNMEVGREHLGKED